MATSGKGTGIVGYNVQTAVDVEHHLIVAHEVTNLGHDRTQLVPMALKAQEATGNEEITVLADRGYFNGDQVLACENTGVLPCIPKTLTSSSAKRGLFTRQDFVYDAEKDHYTCPAGEHLTRGFVRSDRRGDIDHYRHLTACFTCLLKPKCTPDKLRKRRTMRALGTVWQRRYNLDSGAAENGRRGQKTGFVLGLSCAVFGVKTESGRDQTQPCASRVFLAITKLASANRVRSCAVFLARPR